MCCILILIDIVAVVWLRYGYNGIRVRDILGYLKVMWLISSLTFDDIGICHGEW